MTAYNLYLLDVTRDPKILDRLSRITGVPRGVLGRHYRSAPFLVLKESPLSKAVAIRRDLERIGLTLRLERVENPSGDQRHPLADESDPEDAVEEIVLEEGKGFSSSPPPAEKPAPKKQPKSSPKKKRPALLWLLLLPAVLALAFTVGSLLPEVATEGFADLKQDLQQALPEMLDDAKRLLSGRPRPDDVRRFSAQVDEVDRKTAPVWNQLPEKTRQDVEELKALERTLELRRARQQEAETRASSTRRLENTLAGLSPQHEDFWEQLDKQLSQHNVPRDWQEQSRLSSLAAATVKIQAEGGRAARRLENMMPHDNQVALERLRARSLAANLRHKGVRWFSGSQGVETRTDLPDGLELDLVSASGSTHKAHVSDGHVLFESLPEDMQAVSLRLAELNRQPPALARLLEHCLKIADPQLYDATLPGQTLPRFRGDQVRQEWSSPDLPDLSRDLQTLGLDSGFPNHPELTMNPDDEASVQDLVLETARAYRRYRVWPHTLTLKAAGRNYSITGTELLMLSGWNTL